MLRMNTLIAFKNIDQVELRGLLLRLAEKRPELFSDVVDAMEVLLVEDLVESVEVEDFLQEMREETCNGYPMYPELHE